MQFFFIVLIFCLVLFLFRLYHVANDDYVLVKKNITLEEIFNCALVCSLSALFFARLFHALINPEPVFQSPLGFLLFPYFPGLSLLGGVVGGALSLFIYSRIKKFPMGRVFDFFTVSFAFILPFGLIGYFLFSQNFSIGGIVLLGLFTLIGLGVNIYLYPKASSLGIKDGSISILFLIFFSISMLLAISIDHPGSRYFLSHKENFLLLIMLFFGIVLIVKQEIIGRMSIGYGK